MEWTSQGSNQDKMQMQTHTHNQKPIGRYSPAHNICQYDHNVNYSPFYILGLDCRQCSPPIRKPLDSRIAPYKCKLVEFSFDIIKRDDEAIRRRQHDVTLGYKWMNKEKKCLYDQVMWIVDIRIDLEYSIRIHAHKHTRKIDLRQLKNIQI